MQITCCAVSLSSDWCEAKSGWTAKVGTGTHEKELEKDEAPRSRLAMATLRQGLKSAKSVSFARNAMEWRIQNI